MQKTLRITQEDSQSLDSLKDMFGVDEDQTAMRAALDLTRELVRRAAIGDKILIQRDNGTPQKLELHTRSFSRRELRALENRVEQQS